MTKKIGIFGGSFNPPHIGHVAICEWLFAKKMVDEIWVIPCFSHPFGKELESFKTRFEMCLFAFKEFGKKVQVLRIEKTLGGVSHTIRTIKHLKVSYPDLHFLLITGSDVQSQTSEWLDFDQIKEIVSIIEIPRGPASPIPDVSASEVRRRISVGAPYLDLVPREVAVYIVTHGLFR